MPSIFEPMIGKVWFLIGVLTVFGLNVLMILTGYDVRIYSLIPYGLFLIYFGLQYWGVQTPHYGTPDTRSKKEIKRWKTLDRTHLTILSIYLFNMVTGGWLMTDAETMCTITIVLMSIAIVTRLLFASLAATAETEAKELESDSEGQQTL